MPIKINIKLTANKKFVGVYEIVDSNTVKPVHYTKSGDNIEITAHNLGKYVVSYEDLKELGPRVLKDYYESYLQLLTQLHERKESDRLLLEVNRLVEKGELHEGILHHLLTYTMKTRLKSKKV